MGEIQFQLNQRDLKEWLDLLANTKQVINNEEEWMERKNVFDPLILVKLNQNSNNP